MSPHSHVGGDERARTADPLLAKQVLSRTELHPQLILQGLAPSKPYSIDPEVTSRKHCAFQVSFTFKTRFFEEFCFSIERR